ncbi:hypothetical protein C8J56DRAFT_1012248 [Mycena floridula]|nr:hypothetical protein C8J56DRAFT_1012248 [Mycena floridula]
MMDDDEDFTWIAVVKGFTGGYFYALQFGIRIPVFPGQVLDVLTQWIAHCSIPITSGCRVVYTLFSDKFIMFIDLSNPSDEDLEALSQACQPASFGRGNQDVMDESYRKAGKLDSSQFSLPFDLHKSGIMDRVVATLLQDGKSLRTELYKLNVYGKGSFFKAHKDTPRGDDMIGSLVVVFSTAHEGGNLILRHKDQEYNFDSSKECAAIKAPSIGYIAFYSDIEHEVIPVTSGYRVTLTYNLYVEKALSPLAKTEKTDEILKSSIHLPLKSTLEELLADSSFLPKGGLLGWGLQHSYPYLHNTGRRFKLKSILNALKGSDATLHQVCSELELGSKLKLLYAGSMIKGADDSGRSSSDSEEKTPKVRWVTPPTEFNRVSTTYIAYGNEASSEFTYGDLCLIVEIPSFDRRK